ncbi:MAG: glucose-6-phosphate isomerase [Desulfurivibrionaceae bacterium]|nr:glucose-6-phosphate isomerase [Desulfurivibrionaceae bacterium]
MDNNFRNMDLLPAYDKLRQAARHPYDLRMPEALNPQRLAGYIAHAGSYRLLYATQRVDDSTLELLRELAEQSGAVEQFKMMKRGAVMNRIEGFASENRRVLHTASRDIFSASPENPEAAGQARCELDKLRNFLADLETGRLGNARGEMFTNLVNIGIGGSDLGPRAVYLALKPFSRPDRRVLFISNVDPDDCAAVLKDLDLSRTLVAVVSKSGATLETLTNEALAKKAFRGAGLDPARHFLAVTGENSPMNDPGRYLRSFYLFDYICGRYSTSSLVGGLLLSFAIGFDNFQKFLEGANRIDRAAEEPDLKRNLPLLLAMLGIWNRNFLNCETLAILPYSQALSRFVAHLQQCDMESNGKSINRQGGALAYHTGPVIWGEPGTNGQHSFYQALHQGTAVVPCEFIGFRHSQYREDLVVDRTSSQEKLVANLLAQAVGLATGAESRNPNRRFPGNRPGSILLAERLTPETMGELLAIYESKIAFQGFVWNINSFDQEGVQLGKVLADRLLGLVADGSIADPLGRAILKSAAFGDGE